MASAHACINTARNYNASDSGDSAGAGAVPSARARGLSPATCLNNMVMISNFLSIFNLGEDASLFPVGSDGANLELALSRP
eukprot:gene22888-30063_t